MGFQHVQTIIMSSEDNAVRDQAFSDLINSGEEGVLPFLTDLLHSTSSTLLRNRTALALHDLGDPKAVPALIGYIAEDRTKDIGTLLYALIPFDPREYLSILIDAVCKTDHAGGYETIVKVIMIIDEFKGPIGQDQKERALSQLDSYIQDAILPVWKQELLNGLHDTIAICDLE